MGCVQLQHSVNEVLIVSNSRINDCGFNVVTKVVTEAYIESIKQKMLLRILPR